MGPGEAGSRGESFTRRLSRVGRDPSGTSDLRVVPGPAASLSKALTAPQTCRTGSPLTCVSTSLPEASATAPGTTALWGLVQPLGSELGFWNP